MTTSPAPGALTPDQFNATAARIEAEVSKIIIGQADVIRHTLLAIIANWHVLL